MGVIAEVRNSVWKAYYAVTRPVGNRIVRWVLSDAETRVRIAGLEVCLANVDGEPEVIAKLEGAFDLIQNSGNGRFERFSDEVDRILVAGFSLPEEYVEGLRTVVLRHSRIVEDDERRIAAQMIEQACMARQIAQGGAYELKQRLPYTRACVKEQVDFLRDVPGGQPLAHHFEEWLTRSDPR